MSKFLNEQNYFLIFLWTFLYNFRVWWFIEWSSSKSRCDACSNIKIEFGEFRFENLWLSRNTLVFSKIFLWFSSNFSFFNEFSFNLQGVQKDLAKFIIKSAFIKLPWLNNSNYQHDGYRNRYFWKVFKLSIKNFDSNFCY